MSLDRRHILSLPSELAARIVSTLTLDHFFPFACTCKTLYGFVMEEAQLAILYMERFGKDKVLEAMLAFDEEEDELVVPESWRVPRIAKVLLINRPSLLKRLLLTSNHSLALVRFALDRLLTTCMDYPKTSRKVPFALSMIIDSPRSQELAETDNLLDIDEGECLEEEPELFIFCFDTYLSSGPSARILEKDPSDRILMGFMEMEWNVANGWDKYARLLELLKQREDRISPKWLRSCLSQHASKFKFAGRSEGISVIQEAFTDCRGEEFALDALVYASRFLRENRNLSYLRQCIEEGKLTLDYLLQPNPPFAIPYGQQASVFLWDLLTVNDMTMNLGETSAEQEENIKFWLISVYPVLLPLLSEPLPQSAFGQYGRTTLRRTQNASKFNLDNLLRELVHPLRPANRSERVANILKEIIRDNRDITGAKGKNIYRITPTFMTWLVKNAGSPSSHDLLKTWFEVYQDPSGNNGTVTQGIHKSLAARAGLYEFVQSCILSPSPAMGTRSARKGKGKEVVHMEASDDEDDINDESLPEYPIPSEGPSGTGRRRSKRLLAQVEHEEGDPYEGGSSSTRRTRKRFSSGA
ncbi:uncharacterized protein SPPG_01281 [Spizellomyces punctatus DAOM BR117]|uniref:F-box domain-containing protein n=1 Tax=Spizellomyces punctatus (strain DAOM BR117) TaxID=645134 RepID=A0A0L0HR23_SPIPD|nr:uncharacterized protein SPPG_01281 [Spizellomyces punctatus DAOM BR117]KND03826.1 hypothetical protein SPPG_01281 [Spizellomyces punctatus DAOM BR117]|eukprot:XP_016611865.1 hypothetical protein SPPG_01281 [Spizellomyces punctatus DAOM BR117]